MKHEMNILGQEGHTCCTWDPSNPESVSAANETFEGLRSQGYRAAAMNADGSTGSFVESFDPSAENILFVLPVVGG